ncbi:hypothetical protein PLEOSDRAFT_1108534 [Pleurotus ostreatus PC15]|uniref:Uncharacterized protein n=2 Tax=Pleurotus TaxID=5320 RepID=A0A067N7Q9_PLEO1|nr:hypothetical protein CCMSSC00406_0008567 [Pleurotus cornucopiae]KDQ24073.1 hypothetical protein PLEOSDRAFT_1108534 [Pleurotus ostreatus PC15]
MAEEVRSIILHSTDPDWRYPSQSAHIAKRQRVMAPPDGFSKSVTKRKVRPAPQSLPKIQDFASAFGDVLAGPSTSSGSASGQRKMRRVDHPFAFDGAKAASIQPPTTMRGLPTTASRVQPSDSTLSVNDPMRFQSSSVNSKPPRPKADNLHPKNLRILLKPQGLDDSRDKVHMKKALITPPNLSLESSMASGSKKPLSRKLPDPPPLPAPEAPPPTTPKRLRTINTTRMALVTDPTSSDGAAELLSLFLQDKKYTFAKKSGAAAAEDEANRGVNLSPEKRGKGGPKFTRGGLAERASQLFSQTHTSISLWQRETEILYRSSPTSLVPDLRLKITRILHAPGPNLTTYCGLAECTRLNREVAPQLLPSTPFFLGPSKRTETPYLVLFSFTQPPLAYSADLGIRTATRFTEGREVLVWRPWQEANVTFEQMSNVSGDSDTRSEEARKVLFCSRFMIKT